MNEDIILSLGLDIQKLESDMNQGIKDIKKIISNLNIYYEYTD